MESAAAVKPQMQPHLSSPDENKVGRGGIPSGSQVLLVAVHLVFSTRLHVVRRPSRCRLRAPLCSNRLVGKPDDHPHLALAMYPAAYLAPLATLMVADLNSYPYYLVYGSLIWLWHRAPPLGTNRLAPLGRRQGVGVIYFWRGAAKLYLILPWFLGTSQSHITNPNHDTPTHTRRDPSRQPGSARCAWYSEDRNGWLRHGDSALLSSFPRTGGDDGGCGPRHFDTASSRRAKRLEPVVRSPLPPLLSRLVTHGRARCFVLICDGHTGRYCEPGRRRA